ncbi:hypothetical protein MMC12_003616 [Toensbergia leucococca]|nr:hypothetical protein [Toensbergia leucococca]
MLLEIIFTLFFSISLSSTYVLPVQIRDAPSSTSIVLATAPKSASCAGAPSSSSECRTASQAAPIIAEVFSAYDITSPGEMAALISTMAFESGDFEYNINIYPGNPGQGTRNMQMASYNVLYAHSIPALASELSSITNGAPASSLSTTQLNAVRGLLIANDSYDFGSAVWFLTTQCSESVRTGLQSGGQAGWENYVSGCLGTTATSDRQAYWERASQAFAA